MSDDSVFSGPVWDSIRERAAGRPETEDRFAGLPAEVVELAGQAACARCKKVVIETNNDELAGTVMANLYIPGIGARERLFLCGRCGLAAREFLHPELADNAMFQLVKEELLSRFS